MCIRDRCDQLRRVLGQSAVAHLGVSELAFDHPKRVLYLCTDASFDLLGLLRQSAPRRVLLLLALAGAHGHVPVHARCIRPLGSALITGIGKDHRLLAMQQRMALGRCV